MTSQSQAVHYNETGNRAYQTESYGEAIEYYTKAIGFYPREPKYYCNRAKCHLMQGNHDMALDDCRAAANIDPDFPRAIHREAECFIAMGKYAEAKSSLRRLEKLHPGFEGSRKLSSRIEELHKLEEKARNTNDNQLALQLTSELLESAPGCKRFLALKIECLLNERSLQEAKDLIEKHLSGHDQDPNVLFVRGLFSYYKGDLDETLTTCKRVLQGDPDYTKVIKLHRKVRQMERFLENGREENRKGNYEAARDIYSHGLTIDDSNDAVQAKFLLNRAIVQLKLGNAKEAKEDCDRVIAINEVQGKAFYQRALSYIVLRDKEGALKDLNRAYELQRHPEIQKKIKEIENMDFRQPFDFDNFMKNLKTGDRQSGGAHENAGRQARTEPKKDKGISLEELEKLWEDLNARDHKEVFVVPEGGNQREIQKFFNGLMKKYHPDNYNFDPERKAICQNIIRCIQAMKTGANKER